MVTLAVPEDAITRPVTASGYLVPRSEQRTITACSWGSSKWAEWRLPGQVVLRISAGRDGDERALELGDDDLLEAVLVRPRPPHRAAGPADRHPHHPLVERVAPVRARATSSGWTR